MPLYFISGHWLCHCQAYSGSPLQNWEFCRTCLQSRWDSQIPAVCSPVQTKGEWQDNSSSFFLMFLLAEIGNGHKIFSSCRLNSSRCMLEPKRFLVLHLVQIYTPGHFVYNFCMDWYLAPRCYIVTMSQCQLFLNCVSICVCGIRSLRSLRNSLWSSTSVWDSETAQESLNQRGGSQSASWKAWFVFLRAWQGCTVVMRCVWKKKEKDENMIFVSWNDFG